MRIFLFTIFYLAPFIAICQNVSKINKNLELSDSLTFQKEVRLYKRFGVSNYTSVLRIYMDNANEWKAEFYEHWFMTNNEKGFNSKKRHLKPKTDIELIYLNLKLNHILDLPDMNSINWKMVDKGKVITIQRKINNKGDKKINYELEGRKKHNIVDGYVIKVQISDYKNNEFSFSNHIEYLKLYPEIDELIFYSEITNLLSNEFGVWK
ncbi:hypothetical protein [Flavivirga algicola]|uniref:Uncharacterized protein n=1 Tax=Flavivirga algicola TaxID=2729136 RepID=A0ABX1RVN5_9FLAO|nr:hypothetical protein [Flavivirga algicola]NMH87050.1 hypothetical protein [Flavivirga algicola]